MNTNKHLQLDQSYYFKRLHAREIKNILHNINQQEAKDIEKLEELILSKYSQIISSISLLKQIDSETKDINTIITRQCQKIQKLNSKHSSIDQFEESEEMMNKISSIDEALNFLQRSQQSMSGFYNFYQKVSLKQSSRQKFLLIQKEIEENWIHQSIASKEDFISLLLLIKEILVNDIMRFYDDDVEIDSEYLQMLKEIISKIDGFFTNQLSQSARVGLIKQCLGFTASTQESSGEELLSSFIVKNLHARCEELLKPSPQEDELEQNFEDQNFVDEVDDKNQEKEENPISSYLAYQNNRRRIVRAMQTSGLKIPHQFQAGQLKIFSLLVERVKNTLDDEDRCNQQKIVVILQSDLQIPAQLRQILEHHLNSRIMAPIDQLIEQMIKPLVHQQVQMKDCLMIKLSMIKLQEYLTFKCGNVLQFNFFWVSVIYLINLSKRQVNLNFASAKSLIQLSLIKLLDSLSQGNDLAKEKLTQLQNQIESEEDQNEENIILKYLNLILQ